jgi:hypothetical protein
MRDQVRKLMWHPEYGKMTAVASRAWQDEVRESQHLRVEVEEEIDEARTSSERLASFRSRMAVADFGGAIDEGQLADDRDQQSKSQSAMDVVKSKMHIGDPRSSAEVSKGLAEFFADESVSSVTWNDLVVERDRASSVEVDPSDCGAEVDSQALTVKAEEDPDQHVPVLSQASQAESDGSGWPELSRVPMDGEFISADGDCIDSGLV